MKRRLMDPKVVVGSRPQTQTMLGQVLQLLFGGGPLPRNGGSAAEKDPERDEDREKVKEKTAGARSSKATAKARIAKAKAKAVRAKARERMEEVEA